MAKRDKKVLGPSTLIPYVPHEHAEKRHARRLRINESYYDLLKSYLNEHGYNLDRLASDHWKIYNGKVYYEFWPALAKLVKNRKYRHGFHCHDILQVLEIVLSKHVTLQELNGQNNSTSDSGSTSSKQ